MLHLDLETRSDVDLPKCGLDNYAKGRNTDLMCAAYAFGDEPVQLWLPGQPVPQRVFEHIERGGEVWAHNASFEKHLINYVGTRRYGWPYLYTDQMVCTMAMAYAMAIPGSLGGGAAALGLEHQKDLTGKRIMMQLSQPRDVLGDGTLVWWEDREMLEKLYHYCKQDVEVEREAGKRMMRLSPLETKIWRLDQKINERGIAIDFKAAQAAVNLVENEKVRLNREIQIASGNQIATCTAVGQIKTYIEWRTNLDLDSLAKADVVELLAREDLPSDVRTILGLRQEAGKSSTAKLQAMSSGASGHDHRVRGTFQYSGANTRRWAGRRIQLQNLPRPKLSPAIVERILSELAAGRLDAAGIDAIFGSPMSVISNCLRGFLIAPAGKHLAACDFSAIEARVIAWLAGQHSALEIFRTHGKIYEAAASSIFGVPLDQVTDQQRQVGKVAVLALGYGGGVGAFQTMARGYGVAMAPALNQLLKVSSPDAIAWATERYGGEVEEAQKKKIQLDMSKEEFLASDLTKVLWRKANPAIVQFWSALENAAMQAVANPGTPAKVGDKITFKKAGSFLWCRLPSGGVLSYPYPEVKQLKTRWGQIKSSLTYMSEDGQTKKWQRFGTYGGSLAENVTQAVARDLLAESMLRLDDKGFEIVAHVHDEVVCEIDLSREPNLQLREIAKIMEVVPDWASGLPLKAAGFTGIRYRK